MVPSTSSEAMIKVLRSVFATHGVPEHIVSDNGTGFTSEEFQVFMSENGIKHSTTSPYHPASNGLAERAVQTIKQGIAKLEGTIPTRLARFLLSYRITPQSTTGLSPAEILMRRKLRTRLDLLHPDSSKRVLEKQDKLRKTSKTRSFQVGDELMARGYSGREKWIPATVIKVTGPVSYQLETESGMFMRRHVDQLRMRYATVEENQEDRDMDFGPSLPAARATLPRQCCQVQGSPERQASQQVMESTTFPNPRSAPVSTVCCSVRVQNPVIRYSPGFAS